MKLTHWIAAACAALALTACNRGDVDAEPSPLPTTGVTDAMIAQAPGDEWLTYGRDYGEQRFSPLTQISDENVSDLGLAWFADLETARGQEATPLMHDGTLYVSTAWSMVKAFDARTGALKWSYDPEVPRETLAVACCDAVNRGVVAVAGGERQCGAAGDDPVGELHEMRHPPAPRARGGMFL